MPSGALAFLKKAKKEEVAKGEPESPTAKAAAAGGASAAVAVAARESLEKKTKEEPEDKKEEGEEAAAGDQTEEKPAEESEEPEKQDEPEKAEEAVSPNRRGDGPVDLDELDDADLDDTTDIEGSMASSTIGEEKKKKGILEKILDASTECCSPRN